MSITTEKTLACDVDLNANHSESLSFNRPRHWGFDRANAADVTIAMPSAVDRPDYRMPTLEQYTQGMDKLRATANCPVLSPEADLLARELAACPELNAKTPIIIDDLAIEQLKTAKKRKSVAEFLQAQHREALLKRMPGFEQDTNNALRELRSEVSSLSFRLLITNLIVVATIMIGGVAWLA